MLIGGAKKILQRQSVSFVPAADQLEADVSAPWTLRDALVVAAGRDRSASPLAYWQHREIGACIREVWNRLSSFTAGAEPELWSNAKGRTEIEIFQIFDEALNVGGDVAGPGLVELRPWCNPKLVRTCRIPFVPLAALIHAWEQREVGLEGILAEFGVGPTTDPWTILDRVEPLIRKVEASEQVAIVAGLLRSWMRQAEPPVQLPAQFLCGVAAMHGDLPLNDLAALASRTIESAST